MFEDEELRSKYTRLGVEFKKLREKHKLTKDSLLASQQSLKLLEGKLVDQNVHIRNLEQEKESLLFRTQYLTKQATFLQSQLESSTRRNKFSDSLYPSQEGSSGETGDDALLHALQECSTLHEELVSQSAQFLERIALLETQLNEHKREKCRAPEGLHSIAVQTTLEPQATAQHLLPSARAPSLNSGSDSLNRRTEGEEEGDMDSLCTGSVSLPSPSTSSGALNVDFCPQAGVPSTTVVTDAYPATATLRAASKQSPNSSQPHMRTVSLPTFVLPNHSSGNLSVPSFDSAAINNSSDESSIRERLLLHRIGQLERQVAEASLRCSLAARRDKLARKASNVTTSSSISSSSRVVDVRQQQPSHDPPTQDNPEFVDTEAVQLPAQTTGLLEDADEDAAENVSTLLCEVLQSQLAQCNRQLAIYAGRAACASEEVRNLYEHLTATRDQLESQRLDTEAAEQKSRALEEELESTKMRTAQQLSEMALHMAHLTDEINSLRLGTPTQPPMTRSKSSVTNGGGGGRRPLLPVTASAIFSHHHSPVRPQPDGYERSISGSASNVQEKMNSFFTSLRR